MKKSITRHSSLIISNLLISTNVMPKTIIIGSRRSKLAQIQSHLVRDMLLAAWDEVTVTIELFDTRGDLNRHDPLPKIGGKGLFTAELEAALREGKIDLAVHSLKDLPVEDSPGLTILAIPKRAATEDVLIARHASRIAELPAGAVVGTSSLRRASQILALRPDLQIKDIRGNVDTRLRKVTDPGYGYDATLLAQAGLNRLGYATAPHGHPIPHREMLPAPGQGALAVQGRANDPAMVAYLAPLDDTATRAAVTAERAFFAGLGGGCSLPVAALGQVEGADLHLQALVASPDGAQVVRVAGRGSITEAEALGQRLTAEAVSQGAGELVVK
ncbi:MAG: hydroxymethylbilane synthase [Anaerolineae bacterium]|nr:hydroxymethylbilane synthase [Anaerolineae bacterium]